MYPISNEPDLVLLIGYVANPLTRYTSSMAVLPPRLKQLLSLLVIDSGKS